VLNTRFADAATNAPAQAPAPLSSLDAERTYRPRKRAMRQLEKYVLDTRSNRIAQKHPRPRIAVAIPVCNEVERIERCVAALAEQRDVNGLLLSRGQIRIVLLVNGSTDGTYAFILANLERWRVAISVFNIALPASRQNAGAARRMANHAALDVLPERGGALFMTDADSAVPPDWISRHIRLLHTGYDAVAGLVELHPEDCREILPSLLQRGALEDRYSSLLDQIESLVDPISHDPWPRHYNASGANISVRTDALRGMGDFPQIACGEDRLFIRMLEAQGRIVRHDCGIRVLTSGRLFGRAVGGMADTLRHRLREPNAECDPRLEPTQCALYRATLRKELRTAWAERDYFPSAVFTWAKHFAISDQLAVNAGASKTFEDAWQKLEGISPRLKRQPVSPCDLATEIRRAEDILGMLCRNDGAARNQAEMGVFA